MQLRAINIFVQTTKLSGNGGRKKQESNSEVGRTVLRIFGLKSQLSGKQSCDWFGWNHFLPPPLQVSLINVCTYASVRVCLCCLAQWQSRQEMLALRPQPGRVCSCAVLTWRGSTGGAAPLHFSCHQLALTALTSLTRF